MLLFNQNSKLTTNLSLQLARSNSRKMPSQADEEAHQLSYIQKHLSNMISLLAEPGDGEGEEAMVCGSFCTVCCIC